ncbi:hypothetical protein J2W44_005654 [Priestia aryabhattai]|nr:hypothetical protein [Priestia aryabhattai]
MYACVENYTSEEEIKCRVCYDKLEDEVKNIIKEILLNLQRKDSDKDFRDFIKGNVRFLKTGVKEI